MLHVVCLRQLPQNAAPLFIARSCVSRGELCSTNWRSQMVSSRFEETNLDRATLLQWWLQQRQWQQQKQHSLSKTIATAVLWALLMTLSMMLTTALQCRNSSSWRCTYANLPTRLLTNCIHFIHTFDCRGANFDLSVRHIYVSICVYVYGQIQAVATKVRGTYNPKYMKIKYWGNSRSKGAMDEMKTSMLTGLLCFYKRRPSETLTVSWTHFCSG